MNKPIIPRPLYKNQSFDYKNTFVDELFPNNELSISCFDLSQQSFMENEHVKIPDGTNKLWLKPVDVFKKNDFLLYDSITVDDVHPGQLGDLYFLNTLTCLAEKKLIERVFDRPEISENGVYVLKVYIQGKQKLIAVDDFIPCFKNKKWAFSYSGPNEVWVQILEKVWAKMNKSYANTLIGSPADPFYGLNEAPCIEYIHKKYSYDKIWETLQEAMNKGFIVFSSPDNPLGDKLGLFKNHSYNILSVKSHGDLKLIYMQNKFGGYEWQGDYSDNSTQWTDELKQVFNYNNCEDGKFYIKCEDYYKFFPNTYVLKYTEDYFYTFTKFIQTSLDRAVSMKISITEPVNLYLTLHSKQLRFFSKVKNYSCCMNRIIIARVNETGYETLNYNKRYKFIGANAGKSEKLVIELENLHPGDYHIFIHSNWKYFDQINCSMVVSTYSNKQVKIEELDKDNIPDDFLTQILYSAFNYNDEGDVDKTADLVFRVDKDENDIGYYMVLLKNNTGTDLVVERYSIDYTNIKVLSDLNLYKSSNKDYKADIRLYLKQNEEQLHVFELLDDSWNCKFKVGNLEYKIDKESLDDKISCFLAENLHKCERKENLNKDLIYYEMETHDGIIMILENVSPFIYKVKIDFSNLVNLKKPWIANRCFVVQANRFDYIKMFKKDINSPINFTFSFLYKKFFA